MWFSKPKVVFVNTEAVDVEELRKLISPAYTVIGVTVLPGKTTRDEVVVLS